MACPEFQLGSILHEANLSYDCVHTIEVVFDFSTDTYIIDTGIVTDDYNALIYHVSNHDCGTNIVPAAEVAAFIVLYDNLTDVEKSCVVEALFGITARAWIFPSLAEWDECDDNDGCDCMEQHFDAATIVSKSQFGTLVLPGYLEEITEYSGDYLIQMEYDEPGHSLNFSNMHSQVHTPTDPSYVDIDFYDAYKSLLLVTYLGWDKYNAQFIEQILYQGAHNDDGEWSYEIGTFPCLYHAGTGCIEELPDFSTLTMYVTYQDSNGNFIDATYHHPVNYVRKINWEDGKPIVDGVYKTYYMLLPDFSYLINNGSNTGSPILADTWFYIEYTDSEGDLQQVYATLKEDTTLDASSLAAVAIDNSESYVYDFTVTDVWNTYIQMIEDIFDVQTGEYFLDNYNYIANSATSNTTGYDAFVGEDAHLVTWELREDVIESINDCEIPCERFSFDTWVALMQKKMSAKDFFCRDNLTEATRILFTTRERCKNC